MGERSSVVKYVLIVGRDYDRGNYELKNNNVLEIRNKTKLK